MGSVIVLLLIVFIVCWYRRFAKSVYAIALIDILLRIVNFIGNNIGIKEVRVFVNKYVPSSIISIINEYTTGTIEFILSWIFVALVIVFWIYTFNVFLKRRR